MFEAYETLSCSNGSWHVTISKHKKSASAQFIPVVFLFKLHQLSKLELSLINFEDDYSIIVLYCFFVVMLLKHVFLCKIYNVRGYISLKIKREILTTLRVAW